MSPALQADSLTTESPGKPPKGCGMSQMLNTVFSFSPKQNETLSLEQVAEYNFLSVFITQGLRAPSDLAFHLQHLSGSLVIIISEFT